MCSSTADSRLLSTIAPGCTVWILSNTLNDRGEERGLRAAIGKAVADNAGLLEIKKCRGDREQQHERTDTQQIGRAHRVGDAGKNAAADRAVFSRGFAPARTLRASSLLSS